MANGKGEREAMTYRVVLHDSEGVPLNSWDLTLFSPREGTLNLLRESDRVKLLDDICDEVAEVERPSGW